MQLFANNIETTLASALSSAAVSLTVTDATGMPSPSGNDYFLLTLCKRANDIETDVEIVKCTARIGAVLTIARAQEGTTAGTYAAGDIAGMRLTADSLERLPRIVDSSLTVTVGSTGDYASIQAAVNDLVRWRAAQSNLEIIATINILTGTTITDRLSLFNCDSSWIKITSADATVTATVTAELFRGYRARLPQIAALFDMGGNGSHGIACNHDSFVFVHAACGVINAGSIGLYLDNSRASADGADFSGAVANGVDARYGSVVTVRGADVSGAAGYGISISYGSMADAWTINASGCQRGIDVSSASKCGAISADASGCTGYGVHATGASNVDFYNGQASACTGVNVIYSAYGAMVDAVNANAQMGGSPAITDIKVSFGGIISAVGAIGGTSIAVNTPLANGIIFG